MTKKRYNVRWYAPTDLIVTRANVDVMAISDHHAKIQADSVGRELNVTGLYRLIYEGGRRVD